MTIKKKAGRPKKAEGDVFEVHITSTFNKADAESIYTYTKENDISISGLIRTATLLYIKSKGV